MLGRWRRDLWTSAAEYASASSVGTLMTAGASGHFIGFAQPDLVVTAIGQVLQDARPHERRGEVNQKGRALTAPFRVPPPSSAHPSLQETTMKTRPLMLSAALLGAVTEAASSTPTPWIMQGLVRTAAGQPGPGMRVGADNGDFDGSELWTGTDAQGRSRLDLKGTVGSWPGVARIKRTDHGRTIDMTLEPDNDASFGGKDGAVRTFTWRLSGRRAVRRERPRPEQG